MKRLSSIALVVVGLVLGGCGESDVDATATPSATVANDAVVPTPVAPRENPVVDALALNDSYRAILVDRGSIANPRDLETIARSYCEGLPVCRAAIWFDENLMPRQMPVSASAVAAQAYAFGRTSTGAENSMWNCDIFPEFEEERRCLPRRLG